jgi:ketoreductase RED2
MGGSVDLSGKVALVTGSSSGIGAAIARRLAHHGAAVVVNSSSSVAEGEAVAEGLDTAIYVQADVRDEQECQGLVAVALEQWGRLDILVNNAGWTKVVAHDDLDAATDEVWRRILDTNVMGPWYLTRAAAPALRASGAGCVVNVSSLAGVRVAGSSLPYAVSKAALNHMTRLLAAVLGPEIRVNALAPGLVDTPWTEDWDAVREAITARAPLRRSGSDEDMADACMALVQAGYVTGEVLIADGGMHLRMA